MGNINWEGLKRRKIKTNKAEKTVGWLMMVDKKSLAVQLRIWYGGIEIEDATDGKRRKFTHKIKTKIIIIL